MRFKIKKDKGVIINTLKTKYDEKINLIELKIKESPKEVFTDTSLVEGGETYNVAATIKSIDLPIEAESNKGINLSSNNEVVAKKENVTINVEKTGYTEDIQHKKKTKRYPLTLEEQKGEDFPALLDYIKIKGNNISVQEVVKIYGEQAVLKELRKGTLYKKKGNLVI